MTKEFLIYVAPISKTLVLTFTCKWLFIWNRN